MVPDIQPEATGLAAAIDLIATFSGSVLLKHLDMFDRGVLRSVSATAVVGEASLVGLDAHQDVSRLVVTSDGDRLLARGRKNVTEILFQIGRRILFHGMLRFVHNKQNGRNRQELRTGYGTGASFIDTPLRLPYKSRNRKQQRPS
ncbi:hypothetical protein MPL3356_80461 [Mesorhizobium plurifarium]|uniref:Uncharacterized protein n=1 Tax=Mesorhizobium plurifarium TaxID=69974 RepID=A0A090EJK8_MESPL|nr:hypothetical protein MPL3356_80461 [Mesorhizobium plurifarium]